VHELSIAMSLAELVEEQLAGEPDAAVTAVDIRIGTLSSVVPAAPAFKAPSCALPATPTPMRWSW
jgi:Zn finger protein HypA/HybF involved in hydrogenase expression